MSNNKTDVADKSSKERVWDCFNVPVSSDARKESMTSAQILHLHTLSKRCTDLGMDSKGLWRRVFAESKVKQIDGTTSDQFAQARDLLQAEVERLTEKEERRRLIGKILRATIEKDAKAELDDFCARKYGQAILYDLTIDELVNILLFITDFETKPLAPRPSPQLPKAELLPWGRYLLTYKLRNIILIAFGGVIGASFL